MGSSTSNGVGSGSSKSESSEVAPGSTVIGSSRSRSCSGFSGLPVSNSSRSERSGSSGLGLAVSGSVELRVRRQY